MKNANLTNREKKQVTKAGKHYCDTCDANHVGKNEKCAICRKKSAKGRKMLKKFYE